MEKSKNNSILKNFIWRFAERCGAQLVTFIVSIALARILTPEDYGQIALITVFTTIMQVFVDSGLGTALIQKRMLMIWIFRQYSTLILWFVWSCTPSCLWWHQSLQPSTTISL